MPLSSDEKTKSKEGCRVKKMRIWVAILFDPSDLKNGGVALCHSGTPLSADAIKFR
jgi:hypothetical protein